jgi:Skp family chaperone for outer membrane proteins
MTAKRTFATVLGIALATLGTLSVAAESTAYINMSEVFESYYKTKRAEASLRKQEAVYQERADASVEELKELKERFDKLRAEAQSVALSDEAKQRKAEDAQAVGLQLRDKEQDLKQYMAEKKREMQGDYMKSRNAIVEEIVAVVRNYSEQQGYDTVLDVSGMSQNMLPVILKHPEDREITEVIVQKLNRGHEDELEKYGDGEAAPMDGEGTGTEE